MSGLFFHQDPMSGRRRPLPLFWGMLAVGVFLVLLVAAGFYLRFRRTSPVTPTPVPLTSTFTPQPTDTPTPTATWTPAPTEDPIAAKRQELLRSINECEKDPAKWELVRRENTKFHYILKAPRCALDDLGRTLAWYMLVTSGGWTPEEALEVLGLQEWPTAFPREANPPKDAVVPFRTTHKGWYGHTIRPLIAPGARLWQILEDGQIALVTFAPQGCYYAVSTIGGKVIPWSEKLNFPFRVQCLLFMDLPNTHLVGAFKGGVFAGRDDWGRFGSPPLRAYFLVAYSPELGWRLQGAPSDKRFFYTYDEWRRKFPDVPLEQAYAWAEEVWGVAWTEEWLRETWGLEPKPLPDGWQEMLHSTEDNNLVRQWQQAARRWSAAHAFDYITREEMQNLDIP